MQRVLKIVDKNLIFYYLPMLGYPWRWFFLNHHGHFLGCWKSKVRVKTDPRGVVKTVQVSLGLETPVGFDVIDVYE